MEKGGNVLYVEDTPIDERGRRQFKETSLGKLTYSYYANSLLQGITSSNADGVKLGYRYDEANRLAFVDDSSQLSAPGSQPRTTSYAYNANGSLQTVTYANSVQHAYTYDTLNRLRTLNVAKGAITLHSYEYKLLPSGHRQQIIENGARTTAFSYDSLYRLTGENLTGDTHGNNGNVAYGLDKVGNRESRNSSITSIGSTTSTFNNRDWLSGDTYDANGNTTLSFNVPQPDVYDFEDHLIIRRKTDGTTVNLSYDADGILRQKTLLSAALSLVSATGYLTDTQNPTGYAQVMEERINAASGITMRTYAYGSDLISRSEIPNTQISNTRYYAYDGLGSVRELTNETGTVTDAYDYDAFGILTYRAGTTDNAHLYRGERFESDIGQYYLRARFYNQLTGRFWNQDSYEGSVTDPTSLHKYLYADSDPINNFDLTGNFSLAELSTAQGVDEVMNKMISATTLGLRIYRTAKSVADFIGIAKHAYNILMAVSDPSAAGMLRALESEITKAFGPANISSMLNGVSSAFSYIVSSWAGAVTRLEPELPMIAGQVSTYVLSKLPKYLAAEAKGAARFIVYAPSAPFGGFKDIPIKVNNKLQINLSPGGGRLFGFGIAVDGSADEQLFRLDYFDWYKKPPAPRYHYHMMPDLKSHHYF